MTGLFYIFFLFSSLLFYGLCTFWVCSGVIFYGVLASSVSPCRLTNNPLWVYILVLFLFWHLPLSVNYLSPTMEEILAPLSYWRGWMAGWTQSEPFILHGPLMNSLLSVWLVHRGEVEHQETSKERTKRWIWILQPKQNLRTPLCGSPSWGFSTHTHIWVRSQCL